MSCIQAYPGYIFKNGAKFRNLEVTEKSMLLHYRHAICEHQKSRTQHKKNKRDWQEMAEWAALATALAIEAVNSLGLPDSEAPMYLFAI